LLSGWISQAIASASALTRARSGGVGRQQRRLRPRLVEVLDDRQDCVRTAAIVVEHRHQRRGIHGLESGGELLATAFQQVHRAYS
jgi:hypothetical protein